MPARAASLLLVLLLAIAAAATARPAAAANWLELNFGLSGPRYDATVPLCDNPGVLGRITSRFSFWMRVRGRVIGASIVSGSRDGLERLKLRAPWHNACRPVEVQSRCASGLVIP